MASEPSPLSTVERAHACARSLSRSRIFERESSPLPLLLQTFPTINIMDENHFWSMPPQMVPGFRYIFFHQIFFVYLCICGVRAILIESESEESENETL